MHFIDGTEGGREAQAALARRALELKAGAAPVRAPGKRLIAAFLNPSLRTRTSLEAAAGALGVQAVVLAPGSSSWGWEFEDGVVMDADKPEHAAEAVRVLSGYGDALAVRAFAGLADAEVDRADPVLSAFQRYATVPVINLESARWHPMQGLADTATWMSHLGEDLRGVPLTLTWAPHPKALPTAVPNQVLLSAALHGMHITVAHPEGMDLDPLVMARASELARASGGEVELNHDQDAAVRGARVVVAKSWGGWSGYGRREDEAKRRALLGDWRVDEALMARTDSAGFMHCLPVRRGVVVDDAVLDGSDSWAIEEAHNRLWTAMAVLEQRLGSA